MLRMISLVLLSPLFVAGMLLRLAFFLPFALMFLLPMVVMRPRMLTRAPMLFRHVLLGKRGHWHGKGYGRWHGNWRSHESRLERVSDPVQI